MIFVPTIQAAVSPRWRAVRGWTFAGIAALLAAAGHRVGGGSAPDLAALLSVAALAGVVVTAMAGRRLGFLPLLGLLGGAQLVFHLTFALTEHHPHPVDAPRMLLFHLMAAVLTATVAAGGERALFALLRRLPPLRLELPAPPTVPVPLFLVPTTAQPARPSPYLPSAPLRGPPALTAPTP